MALIHILILIILFIYLAWNLYKKWLLGHWKRNGVPILNISKTTLLSREISITEEMLNIYKNIKENGWKHAGGLLFTTYLYIPTDLELIKNIMQKDFKYFNSHGTFVDEENDPLTGHLFSLEGAKWKNLRIKLTPTFTSGKMRMMFETFVSCTNGLKDILEEYSFKAEPLDIKDILGRFTTDIIGNTAFGIECNSMKEPDNTFRKYGKKIFTRTKAQFIKLSLINSLPHSILHFLGFKFIESDVSGFFMDLVKDTVKYREENNIIRKDFIHLLLQLKNQGKVSDEEGINKTNSSNDLKITFNELAAQCFVFFAAGFETSSTTMTFALYELAVNPDIQQKLRNEIISVLNKHNNKITYEALKEMTYLDQVIKESLRKYPPVPAIPRRCTEDYIIPGTNSKIKKGTRVFIPAIGLHNDPEYYNNPDKFDPERFSEDQVKERHPMSYIPFGEGPRMCIGLRFGLLQSKVGLAAIIKDFKVSLSPKTELPMKWAKEVFVTSVEGGIWLNIKKIA